MDGQKRSLHFNMLAGVLALAAWPMAAHAQAMGKAIVEPAPWPAAAPAPTKAPEPTIISQPLTEAPKVTPAEPPKVTSVAPASTAPTNNTESPTAPAAVDTPKTPVNALEGSPIRRSSDSSDKTSDGNSSGSSRTQTGWFSGAGNIGQVIAALAIVVGLIFILKALARKFVPGAKAAAGKGVIEILARHPLTKNQSIVLVRIGSQIVALNQGKESSESVLVISDGEEVARIIGQIEGKNPNSISSGFNRLMANARMDLEETPDAEGDLKNMPPENLDEQLEEMAAAKRQLMELRQHVRSVRDSLPRT